MILAETIKKPKSEVEPILVRAYEIFVKVDGPNSFHAKNAADHLKRLRSGQPAAMTDSDYDDLEITSENKRGSGIKGDKGAGDSDDDIPSFHPHDGENRMRQSAVYYEQGKFSKAEKLLAEALEIFISKHGDDHALTKACKQNLGVAKHQALNKIWREVLNEVMEEKKLNEGGNDRDNDGDVVDVDSYDKFVVKSPYESNQGNSCIIC